MSENKLVILDGHSVAFRAFFALKPEVFRAESGQYTNAVYGFMNMLMSTVKDIKPTHIAVAFDLPGGSFRNRTYAEYKAGRAATPEEFRGQIDRIQELLTTLGLTYLTKEDYEADDIVATLATRGAEAGMEVFIASGDRDTFQLVTDRVTVMYPGASMADMRMMTPAAVAQKYGVAPARYPELAALVGESADNLPGVPLVGPKTAAQWLNQYDGLDNLLAHADEITGKRGENLRAHAAAVVRNRELNRLLTDLDLGIDLSDLRPRPLDRLALAQLCDSLDFGRIRTRLTNTFVALTEAEADPLPTPVTAVPEADETVRYPEGFAQLLAAADEPTAVCSQAGQVGEWLATTRTWLAGATAITTTQPAGRPTQFDVESVRAGRFVAIRIAGTFTPATGAAERICLYRPGHALIVNLAELDAATGRDLGAFLSENHLAVVDAKEATHALRGAGYQLGGPAFDVQLWDYVTRAAGATLDQLARHYLQREVAAPDDRDELLTEQARTVWQLALTIAPHLAIAQRSELIAQIEAPTQAVLIEMEAAGIAADLDYLEGLRKDLENQVEYAQREAQSYADEPINLSSPKQLQGLLFDKLNMPKTKKTKTGYSTNVKALEQLLEKTGHPFLVALMDHRDKIRRLQTVVGLLRAVGPDGRIHTQFKQTVTATGRLSSVDPNLQNIPARSVEGLAVRAGFVAGPGYDMLMTADYSQIEMRIMAHLSSDSALISAFHSGEDLHTTMAAMVHDIAPEDVTAQMRSQVKATSYGLAYGLSPYGLSQQLSIPVGEAAALRDRYLQRFGKISDYLHVAVEEARACGYTETMFGRRRYLPQLNSDNRLERENAERAALNAPIQGTAADLIKLAMNSVNAVIAERGMRSRLLLQVHDELVFEVDGAELSQLTEIVRFEMGQIAKLSVPLEVSIGVGASWREAAH